MCFVLYAGTTKPIPRVAWQKETPNVAVASLTDRDAPIRAHFSKPEVQYIGSTSCCGCDFPHVTLQNGEWSTYFLDLEKDVAKLESNRFNREALVDLLRASGEQTVELYGIWDGNFSDSPKAREVVLLERILDSDFYFKEQGFYKVRINSEPDDISQKT